MTERVEKVMEVFAYLETKIVFFFETFTHHRGPTLVQAFWSLRIIDEEGMWVRELDKYELSVLSMMKMKCCRPSTSPKLEKQTEPGDDDPGDHPHLHRFAVSTILSMTRRRLDLQATARWTCKRLRDPNQKSGRQLVKTSRV